MDAAPRLDAREAREATVVVAAHAKVNLHLGIYPGRDERGYHRADSVMAELALADEVLLNAAPELRVEFEPSLDVPGDRTVVARAVRELAAVLDEQPNVHVRVLRRVPDKSGLGSSSTDAAAVLRGLCELWGADVRDPRMLAVARGLGADVAFFLDGRPAWMDGVGDCVRELMPTLEPALPVVLVRPQGGVSTVEAYREFDRAPKESRSPEELCAALRAAEPRGVAERLYNNLAPAAIRLVPEVGEVVDWLREQPGVMGAQVTGSGSCCFGICESDDAAREAAARADALGRGWWTCATSMS